MIVRALNGLILSFPGWDGFAISCQVSSSPSFRELLNGKLQLYLLYAGEEQKTVYLGETGGRILRPIEGRRLSSRGMELPNAVLIFSHSPTMNRKILRYMEGRIYFALRRSKNLHFVNTSIPLSSRQPLTKSELERAEEFLRGVWRVLSHLHFEKIGFFSKWNQPHHNYEMRIEIDGSEYFADAEVIQSRIIVKKGSSAKVRSNARLDDHYSTRKNLEDGGILKLQGAGRLVFTQDYAFSSVYTATCVVAGSNSAPQRWVQRGTGRPLNFFRQ